MFLLLSLIAGNYYYRDSFFGFSLFISLIFAIIIFIDAWRQKDQLAIVWGLLNWAAPFPFVFLYLALRQPRQSLEFSEEQRHALLYIRLKRLYFYVAGLILLAVVYWASSDLIYRLLSYFSSASASTYVLASFKRAISLRLSVLVILLPVWAFHLMSIISGVKEMAVEEFIPQSVRELQNYLILILLGFAFILVPLSIFLLYEIFNGLLGVSQRDFSSLTASFSYGLFALIFLLVHLRFYSRSQS